jgi:hypothetical protein
MVQPKLVSSKAVGFMFVYGQEYIEFNLVCQEVDQEEGQWAPRKDRNYGRKNPDIDIM